MVQQKIRLASELHVRKNKLASLLVCFSTVVRMHGKSRLKKMAFTAQFSESRFQLKRQ